jgi:hypothetical protein
MRLKHFHTNGNFKSAQIGNLRKDKLPGPEALQTRGKRRR